MKRFSVLLLLVGTAVQAADDGPVATVRTAPVVEQTLRDTISVLGEVRADPRSEQALNAASGGQVIEVSVRDGQRVVQGAALIRLVTDPAAHLAYAQALDARRFAKEDLARTRELLAGGLATRAQVAAAEKTATDADHALAAQNQLGAETAHIALNAPFAGVVTRVDVHAGDRVAAGARLLTLASSDHRVAVLGVEPADAASLPEHAEVALAPVFGNAPDSMLHVDGVNGLVNPDTRLVDAVVTLGESAALMPGTRVRGLITRRLQRSLAVPRVAVLNDGRDHLFVVRQGKARRIEVVRGIEWHGQIGVSGALAAGDEVVTEGQAVLVDGMAVEDAAP